MQNEPDSSASGSAELVERRATAPRQGSSVAKLLRWAPLTDNPSALIGRANIGFAGGWQINNIPIFRTRDGRLSAGTPSTPLLTSDGVHMRDADNKKRYLPIVSFETNEARGRWNTTIITALREGGIR
jgi:hypothetical protein